MNSHHTWTLLSFLFSKIGLQAGLSISINAFAFEFRINCCILLQGAAATLADARHEAANVPQRPRRPWQLTHDKPYRYLCFLGHIGINSGKYGVVMYRSLL